MTTLGRLVTLSLDNNDLEANCLAQLPGQLQRLDLSSNHFVTIPRDGIAGLLNLTELNLANNRLTTTEGLGVLVSLIDLNLDNNEIPEVSEDVAQCVQTPVMSHCSRAFPKFALRNDKSFSLVGCTTIQKLDRI